MVKLLVLLLLTVGGVAWMIRRAKRCSSCGCGAVEFEGETLIPCVRGGWRWNSLAGWWCWP